MANPIKIYEIKGQDWMKGLSMQTSYAIGGLFGSAYNFDPFDTMGYMRPSLSPVQIDGGTITTQVNHLASTISGSNGYVFALGNRSGTGTPCLYRILMSDSTVVDYSDQIDQNATTGALNHDGITTYRGRIIYEQGGSLRSNTLTPASGNDVNILTVAQTGSGYTGATTAFGVGSDGVLYYTATTGGSIGKIVLTTGTSGNVSNAFSFTDTSLIPRDICNDGIYTIFIADNNQAKVNLATPTCRIFFWDTIKTKADVIFDIPDSYLISARYVNNKVLVMGASGIWVCNAATAPRLVYPLTSSELPLSAAQVTVKDNALHWASNATGTYTYAFGSKIGKDILYSPYQSVTNGANNLHTALVSSGAYFVSAVTTGSNTPKVFLLNSGSDRASLNAGTATSQLVQPFSFSYAKVVLKQPLSSGQDVSLGINRGDNTAILDSTVKSFTTDGAKQTLIFNPKSAIGAKVFEDFTVSMASTAGATIERVSIYAEQTDDYSQKI